MNDYQEKIDTIRGDYNWLSDFSLSDQQLYDLNLLVVRVMIGSDNLEDFYSKLSAILGEEFNQSEIMDVASKIFKHFFLPNQEDIDGLTDWAKKLKLDIPNPAKSLTEDSLKNLSNYDWSQISGLERRAILEDLGISYDEFKKWHENNYGE